MDQLENQVSDLRYLTSSAMSPLAETLGSSSPGSATVGINSAHAHHHQNQNNAATTATSPATDGGAAGAGGTKRSSEDDIYSSSSARQQRSKRNRYISIACNECKRRKIKCNGETPCQRCGNLNLQCLYAPNCCSNSIKDSDEFKQMATTVSRLQEQVETLFSSINALRSEPLRLAPIQNQQQDAPSLPLPSSSTSIPSLYNRPCPTDPPQLGGGRQQQPQPQPQPGGFRGPTSTHFTLDVAKNTLHKMGYSNLGVMGGVEENSLAPDDTPTTSPMLASHGTEHDIVRVPMDPLRDFDKDEMIRLCRLYEEEINIMYPVVRIETFVNHAKTLSSWLEAFKKNGLLPHGGGGESSGIKDAMSLQLKLILCCALVVEEHANSERANKLFESVRPHVDRMLISERGSLETLPLLAIVAGYHFLCNDDMLAWRIMGQVCRISMELGLHRREGLGCIVDEEARMTALHTFWASYTLDRWWSFATGLPYAIQDDEIDPQLPYPDGHPYLVAMISYSQLCARVWRLYRHSEQTGILDLRPADMGDLDRQIKQWYASVPAEAQLELADWESMPRYLSPQPQSSSKKEYDVQRLQIWTYLRLNQIRTWLHTPVLHAHSTIMENLGLAERAVKIAKNTIKYLTHLNNTTNLYRRIQVFYHQFLTNAIAVLFLASCHAPVNFSATCRDEFYMALDLVKDLSGKSWVSKRLWRTIRTLREVAPRLGLAEDPHSSAALTMAGLATGHHAHAPSILNHHPTPPPSSAVPSFGHDVGGGEMDGLHLSSEMSKIFEGVMGVDAVDDGSGPPATPFGVGVGVGETSLYPQFRDMF